MQEPTIVSAVAWSNGKQNPGAYGLRIGAKDREVFRGTERVFLQLPNGKTAEIALSHSFWSKCHEFRSSLIGDYLISTGQNSWPKHQPPTFNLVPISNNTFQVI